MFCSGSVFQGVQRRRTFNSKAPLCLAAFSWLWMLATTASAASRESVGLASEPSPSTPAHNLSDCSHIPTLSSLCLEIGCHETDRLHIHVHIRQPLLFDLLCCTEMWDVVWAIQFAPLRQCCCLGTQAPKAATGCSHLLPGIPGKLPASLAPPLPTHSPPLLRSCRLLPSSPHCPWCKSQLSFLAVHLSGRQNQYDCKAEQLKASLEDTALQDSHIGQMVSHLGSASACENLRRSPI